MEIIYLGSKIFLSTMNAISIPAILFFRNDTAKKSPAISTAGPIENWKSSIENQSLSAIAVNRTSWGFTPAAETPSVNTSYQQNTLCFPLKLEAEATADVFSVFPNPAEEWITLSIPSEKSNASFECDILNITGKVMKHTTISGENTMVNVKDLPAGIYTCRLIANDQSVVIARFVKQ